MPSERLLAKDFSYTSSSRGYTLFYKGKSIGGANTFSTKPLHHVHAKTNIKMFAEGAQREINLIMAGHGPKFMMDAISQINGNIH